MSDTERNELIKHYEDQLSSANLSPEDTKVMEDGLKALKGMQLNKLSIVRDNQSLDEESDI